MEDSKECKYDCNKCDCAPPSQDCGECPRWLADAENYTPNAEERDC